MKNSGKLICICIIAAAIAVLAAFYVWNSKQEAEKNAVIEERINDYNEKKAERV